MKKLFIALSLMLLSVAGASALTLKEAYEEIEKLPDLKGVQTAGWIDLTQGYIGAIPVESAVMTVKRNQVGNDQTVYYGTNVKDITSRLSQSELLLSYEGPQNLLYIYASPAGNSYDLLILADQAYQGQTTAIYARASATVTDMLKRAKVTVTPAHEMLLVAPVIDFR